MGAVGSQDFWVVGARAMFTPDTDTLGQKYAMRDFGIVKSINPQIQVSKAQLMETDGGLKRLADEKVVAIDEAYDIQLSNLSLRNRELLYYAQPSSAFTQAQTEKAGLTERAFPGELLRLLDSDSAKTRLYGLDAFGGIYTGAVSTKVLTTIVAATKTITLTGDQTAVAGLAPGKKFIVQKAGLTQIANSRSYTVVTRTLNAGNTDVVVSETPAANESAIAGQITIENGGVIYAQDVDYEIVSLSRGIVRIKTGGAISVEQDVFVIFTLSAISGKRLLYPQSFKGPMQGVLELWFGRENNAYMTVREARVSLSPNGVSLTIDDYSLLTISAKVLSDISQATVPAGRLIDVLGTVPSVS